MNHNHPLYLLCIVAAAISGLVTPAALLWATWQALTTGQWLIAVAVLVALLGYVVTLAAAVRSSQTQHYQVQP